MARKKTSSADPHLFDVRVTTAPCVLAIREQVGKWRDADYPGATATTRTLLHYWFHTDHRLANRRKFAYHYSQRYAIETLVYLYEIAKVRSSEDGEDKRAGCDDGDAGNKAARWRRHGS
jgi:type III restriction enzyme